MCRAIGQKRAVDGRGVEGKTTGDRASREGDRPVRTNAWRLWVHVGVPGGQSVR